MDEQLLADIQWAIAELRNAYPHTSIAGNVAKRLTTTIQREIFPDLAIPTGRAALVLTQDEVDIVVEALTETEVTNEQSANAWRGRGREASYRSRATAAKTLQQRINSQR